MPRRPTMSDEELHKWFFSQKRICDNGCWEWTGVINCNYGQLSVKGKRILTHRYSLQLHLGREIPKGTEVRHMCHNTTCFNPEHLKEGTHSENMNDMVLASRQAKGNELSQKLKGIQHINGRGEKNGRSKLTEHDVLQIRNDTLKSNRDLAKDYGVSDTQIMRIRNRTTWKYLV
jgi:hypothetical protein